MGGPNLEVFKFGMYIMFPIGIMYYFGTNLDSRFAVPDFWPKQGQTHIIPFERDEITAELDRLKQRRLAARARRLAVEDMERSGDARVLAHQEVENRGPVAGALEAAALREGGGVGEAAKKGWAGWFR